MRFGIRWIGKTLLLLLCVRSVPKESLMLEGKKGVAHVDDFDLDHEDEFKDEDDQASLNSEGRFCAKGRKAWERFLKRSEMARWD